MNVVEASNISKVYKTNQGEVYALKSTSFILEKGTSMAISGPSGSGKTTLMAVCAGLEQPSEGSVLLFDQEINRMNEKEKGRLRREKIGFIFQDFLLLPTFSALENVMISMEMNFMKNARINSISMLKKVGLKDRINHYPNQLSGGEQQRVAVARAFVNNPEIIFADEPTGNLDRKNSQVIEDLLFEMVEENKSGLLMVTHDHTLAQKTDKQLVL